MDEIPILFAILPTLNIADLLEGKAPSHSASMAEIARLCVASVGNNKIDGNAIIIGVYPVTRNKALYPEYGRDLKASAVDLGTAGECYKLFLHYVFIYKLQAKPMWQTPP